MTRRNTDLTVRSLTLSLLLLLPVVTGCASYVNIPSDGSDTAINAVNVPPVPALMGRALAFSINSYPASAAGGPTAEGGAGSVALFRYYLPDSASARTYAHVGATLSALGLDTSISNFDAHGTSYSDIPHYVVTAVRIRGDNAIVDVLLPEKYAPRNLLQVGMQGGLSAWRVMSYSRFIPSQGDAERAAAYSTPRAAQPPAEAEPEPEMLVPDEPTTMPDQTEESESVEEVSEPTPQTQPDSAAGPIEEPLRPVTIPTDKKGDETVPVLPTTQPDDSGTPIEEVTKGK